jgi:hypothetical protein
MCGGDAVTGYLSVSEVARRLEARPRDISDLFYRRALRDDLCPIVAGRRLIPEDYIEVIAVRLRRAGRPCVRAGAKHDPAHHGGAAQAAGTGNIASGESVG